MTDKVMAADSADVEKNKGMAILAYIIFFIPLLAAKESPFAMYHANQGTWLFIFSLVINFIGGITVCLAPVTLIISLVYVVLGIINAANGKMQPLPGFASLPVLFK